jgi:hypothetical protein
VATKIPLPVGALCSIAPRGRSVFGYEFFGSYYDGEKYEIVKTTGDLLDRLAVSDPKVSNCFPFLKATGVRLEEGTTVIVLHAPIYVTSSAVRQHMRLRKESRICEVLTPEHGSRWVRVGLLRQVI